MTELKNLQASGLSMLGPALKYTFDLLNVNRMQSGIDTYGQVHKGDMDLMMPHENLMQFLDII